MSVSETKPLDGHIAVVTGASRGLGKAVALSIGQAGAKVALVARDREALKSVAEEVRKAGVEAEIFQADVTVESQVDGVKRDVLARFGHVDILVNNAGMSIRRPLEEYQIVLTVEKIVENMALTDDQFLVKVPEGTQVQQLE